MLTADKSIRWLSVMIRLAVFILPKRYIYLADNRINSSPNLVASSQATGTVGDRLAGLPRAFEMEELIIRREWQSTRR